MLQNNQKVASDLKKTDGKKKNTVRVEKYISAEYSGTSKSKDCTLLLTEGDSCSADTPLLLRNSDGMIVIRTIDDIHNGEWIEGIDGKLYNTSEHEIWSDKGWTDIKHVMKHVVKKRMYRVLTHTGCIDVTEDHSLLNESGLEITPKDCIVGSKLLHSFPNFTDYSKIIPEDLSILDLKKLWKIASLCNIQFYQIYKRKELVEIINNYKTNKVEQINKSCSISTEEAYIMGFFFADGCCNIYNRKNSQRYYWALDNTNIDYLLKSKDMLEKLYTGNIFKIKNNGIPKQENHLQKYRLSVYDGIDSKEFVAKYNNLMYSKDRCKIVPEGIINNSLEVRKNFYDGYYDGDGSKSKSDSERFDVIGKIGAQGLYFLCKSIGLDVSLNIRNDKMKVYRLNITRAGHHQQYDPLKIKKIIDLGIAESCVYDIETENHHFQGGIGQMIVHNSAATLMLAGLSQEQRKYFGVMPLKGKGLNICNATVKQLQENTELINIKKIMGLESGKKYTDVSELRYGRIMIATDADCITGDTPLTLLDDENKLVVMNVEDIEDWDKYRVWSDLGWTNIKHIQKKQSNKQILRLLTHTGSIDVTEDHPMLNEDGTVCLAKNCKIGQKMLSTDSTVYNDIPSVIELNNMYYSDLNMLATKIGIQHNRKYSKVELIVIINNCFEKQKTCNVDIIKTGLSTAEAWVLGLFLADGSCGIYEWDYKTTPKNRPNEYTFKRISYSWHIDNCDISLLERSKAILEKIYGNNFNIVKIAISSIGINQPYRLILNGGKTTKYIIDKYRELLYYKKYKYIHSSLFHETKEFREQIYNGYYAGDGRHDNKVSHQMDINGKITSQCIFLLCSGLGRKVSVNTYSNKERIYRLNVSLQDGNLSKISNIIKKVVPIEYTGYVYDIETENHHFNAGIGQLIVHNCDGLHIKALLFNMFKNLWPSLFEMPNFINSFTTPIVKATKGNKVLSFFTEAEYNAFKKKNETGWKIKYYKGLGTSSKQEAMEYFKNLQKNTTEYEFSEASNEAFDKVFNKIRADDRKQWLSKYDRNSQSTGSKIRLESFINNDFIHFSNDDLSRSIPNVMDGLKVSQRKILFSAFKRGLYSEIKVAQFAGYVSEHSGYHHGEKSLEDAIVGLAQNFIGSNNINLLEPIGMFGSRLNNGKDSASARYIFTHLSKITKLIFDQRDFGIVDYKNDDGTSVEPWWYIPIIPMILVNGAVGIGTGFSTKMPCFNPKDVINVLLSKLKGETVKELVPWYRNFTGKVIKDSDGIYMTYGVFTETKKEIIITELPIGISVNDYLDHLNNKHSDNFKQITNLSTDTEICIKLTKRNEIKDVIYTLKLTSKVSYSNMNAFDIDSRIMNFSSPETVIEYFFDVRLAYYSKRKRVLLAELDEIIRDLSNRIRFIDEITTKRIKMSDISVAELSEYLQSKNFDKYENSYEYLYKMNLISLTKERQIKLKDKLFATQTERNTLHSKTPSMLYQADLLNLLSHIE
jgi:DNA gyrase/topoisomerase IV subunit B